MFGKQFQLNEQSIPVVQEIGKHMPGGFFIYKAVPPEELIYANEAVLNIFGCDSLEATQAIRALDRPDAVRVPIIAMTANAFDEDVQRSMQAGLNAHLSKPVEPDTLYRTLESLIR